MNKTFYIRISETRLAILDLVDYYGLGLIITRINVPEEHRAQGFGRQLLLEACNAADRGEVVLFLEIAPSGPLDYDQLESWYMRYGFKRWKGIYRRKPVRAATFI